MLSDIDLFHEHLLWDRIIGLWKCICVKVSMYICICIMGAFAMLNGSSNQSQNHANPLVTVASRYGTCMRQYLFIVSGLKQS